MKLLATVFATAVTVVLFAAVMVVQLFAALLPLVAVAILVAWAVRARRSANHPSPTVPRPNAAAPVVITSAPVPTGWVMVPVWVAPPSAGPRIVDAEIGECRG